MNMASKRLYLSLGLGHRELMVLYLMDMEFLFLITLKHYLFSLMIHFL